MSKHEISNSDVVIDSRDVIARIEELEAIDGIQDKIDNRIENEDAEELIALRKLAEEAEGYACDWKYGETLIRDSCWIDYVKELLYDIGALPKDIPNFLAIDWEETAKNIQVDYTSVEFDGVTYWVR